MRIPFRDGRESGGEDSLQMALRQGYEGCIMAIRKKGNHRVSGMSSPSQHSLFCLSIIVFALYVDGIGTIDLLNSFRTIQPDLHFIGGLHRILRSLVRLDRAIHVVGTSQ